MYRKKTLENNPHRFRQSVKTFLRDLISEIGAVLRSIGLACTMFILGSTVILDCSSQGEIHESVSKGLYVCTSGGFVIRFPDGWIITENDEDSEIWAISTTESDPNVLVSYRVYDSAVSLQELHALDSVFVNSLSIRMPNLRTVITEQIDPVVKESDTNFLESRYGPLRELVQLEKYAGAETSTNCVHYHFVVGRREFKIDAFMPIGSLESNLKTIREIVASLLI